jgi:hypothetical protein
MATSGRTGAFQSEVQFTAMNMPSDALVFEQTIPIEAEFRCDWSCSPRRLVLSGSSDYSTYLSVSGPSGEWPLIEILTRQQCVSYEAVSTAPSEVPGHETRVFEIRAIGSDSDEFIDFRRRGSTTPFFSVPVFISDVPSLTHNSCVTHPREHSEFTEAECLPIPDNASRCDRYSAHGFSAFTEFG